MRRRNLCVDSNETAKKIVLVVRVSGSFPLFCFSGKIITKMATPQQKAFCVLQFECCKSVVTVQHAFRRQFNRDSPNANNIRHGIISSQRPDVCVKASVARPSVSEENVQRVRVSFLRSLKKSVRKASRALGMPVLTVGKVLRKRLHMRPYRLHCYRL